MNTIQATGPGGAAILTSVNPNITTGAAMAGDIQDDSDKASTEHGVIMALVTLAIAPVDMLVTSALRHYPILHVITSTAYLAFMVGGLVLGIRISGEYFAVSRPTTSPSVHHPRRRNKTNLDLANS